MKLNSLYNLAGSKKTKKRICRGIGSGIGKTGGRGVKGQKARKGVAIKGFEGGQMPLIFRLPKRGFNTPFPSKYFPLSLEVVKKLINSQRIERDQLVDNNLLVKLNIIKNANIKVKVLGSNHIATPVKFSFHAYSRTAKDAIEKSECKIV